MFRNFTGILLLLLIVWSGCKKHDVIEPPDHHQPEKTVKVLYIVPADRKVNPLYKVALAEAAPVVQRWYKDQMGGKTYFYDNPLVTTLQSDKPSAWFSADNGNSGTDPFYFFFYNAYNETLRLLGDQWDPSRFVYTVYVDAYGQTGAGGSGIAIMPENDLLGLAGLMEEPVSRWRGGWAHELGHAFGLPHPPEGSPDWDKAVMGFGYITFPDAFLRESDKEILANSGFFY